MNVSASEFRQNLYRLLDEVLRTGNPLEIERSGRTLRLVPDEPRSRLDRIRDHADVIVGDPEDLVSIAVWD